MASWQNNPLFRKASAAAIAAARGAFKQTTVGKLVTEVEKLARPRNLAQAGARTEFDAILRDFAKRGMIPGLDARKLAKFGDNVQRYALEDAALDALFKALGPFGGIMRALFKAKGRGGSSRDTDVEAAVKFLQTQGFAVFRPSRPSNKMVEAAAKILRDAGWDVFAPGQMPKGRKSPGRIRPQQRVETESGAPPRVGQVPPGTPEKEASTFLVQAPGSSNVWAYGYDTANRRLYVQFKAPTLASGSIKRHTTKKGRTRFKGTLGRTVIGKANAPGPIYAYENVSSREFSSLERVVSKGKWVWRHLRVLGTRAGHQKDYRLVSAGQAIVVGPRGGFHGTLTYVPRKQVTETALVPRTMKVAGQLHRSLLPRQGIQNGRLKGLGG